MLSNTVDRAFWRDYEAGSLQLALVLVIRTEGSTYRKAGAKMLVSLTGEQWGMVAGGCFDSLIRDEAKLALALKTARLFHVDTRAEEDALFGSGLGCQGRVEMLITPLDCKQARQDLERCLGMRFQTETEHVVYALSDTATGPRGTQKIFAKDALPEECRSKPQDYFIETRGASPRVFVFGNGDDVVPVVRILDTISWRTEVVNHRPLNPKLQSIGECFVRVNQTPVEFFENHRLRSEDLLLIMTHRYDEDLSVLERAVNSPCLYVGLLGPKLRGKRLMNDLPEAVSPDFLKRFYNPAGLDLKSVGPEAIALSIVAEMQVVWSKGSLRHLSEWLG